MSEYNFNQNEQNNEQQTWKAEDNGCTYRYSYHTPSQPPKKKKPTGKWGTAAIIAVLCIVLSGGAGFGGAVAANYLMKNNTKSTVTYENNEASQKESNKDSSNYIQNNTTPASGGYRTTDVTDVVKKSADTVVEIVTESVSRHDIFGQYTTSGAGSGVLVSDDGYIVTNHHVIDGATNIIVTLRNGTKYDAKLIASDAQSDLAVVKIKAENLPVAQFADSDKLEVGQAAIAIGNPLGSLGGSVSLGILSALDREITVGEYTMTLLQTDTAINPGNSGGGLFDKNGALIGIVNAKSGGENIDGLGFAIPANLVKSNVEQPTQAPKTLT